MLPLAVTVTLSSDVTSSDVTSTYLRLLTPAHLERYPEVTNTYPTKSPRTKYKFRELVSAYANILH